MEIGSVTTPFGRRQMSLAMLATQFAARKIEGRKSVDKWKLYRSICEAKPRLGVTDRALALLNALLTFYPKGELSEDDGLVVFPSNAQLSLRAHGMPEQTMRRHLSALITAGLLIRKDSPNGKRYAHKDRGGSVKDAFGFSLAPLLARAEEIEQIAAAVVAERLHIQHLKERLTLCRRDITKLVAAATSEGAEGDWQAATASLQEFLLRLPRLPSAFELEAILEQLTALRQDLLNQLENQVKIRITSANPHQNERHIQRSESESNLEFEAVVEMNCDEIDQQPVASGLPSTVHEPDAAGAPTPSNIKVDESERKTFTLGLVLRACPQIADYAPGGTISGWRDLMTAAVVASSMLGISASAYEEACSVMGCENAAAVVACLLEKGGNVNSAGGYLRDLTRRARRAEFAIAPMLLASLRANGGLTRYAS